MAKFQYPSQISEEIIDAKTIGIVEFIKDDDIYDYNNFNIIDSINTLTTNLKLILERHGNNNKVIEVVGYTSEIGKSSVSRYIAMSLSQQGKRFY